MLAYKTLAVRFDHIPHAAELVDHFIGIACSFCRVREVLVEALHFAWNVRAILVRIIANGYYVIKRYLEILIYIIGGVLGYINVILGHYPYCFGVYAMGFYPGAIDFGFIACKMP